MPESPSSRSLSSRNLVPSKNFVERFIDALSHLVLFSRGPADIDPRELNAEDSWDAKQCLICVPRRDQTELSEPPKYYRVKFVVFLSLCTIFILAKLAQAAGNAGTSTVLGAGGAFDLSPEGSQVLAWSGFAGSVVTTAFTRLIAIVQVCSRWFFKGGANQTSRDNLKAAFNKQYRELSLGRRSIYNFIFLFLVSCGFVAIFFKVINAGLAGIIAALAWLGRTPEQIAQMKTGNAEYMPDKLDDGNTSFVVTWAIVLMVGAAGSALAFDVFREGRIWDKSREIALSVARWRLEPLPLLDVEEGKKERVLWWLSFLLGVVFAICSVAYAFVSTELALTVYTVWWIGGGYKDAIKWGSLAAATTSFPAMMLSAGEDLQKMTKDFFLHQLGLHVRGALLEPLKLMWCNYKTHVIPSVKYVVFPIFLTMILIFGLCDMLNNTQGVKGSLTSIAIKNFDWDELGWTVAEWILAALSALTYFANNGWQALKMGLYICGMIRGSLFTNMDGVTEVITNESAQGSRRVAEMILNMQPRIQPETNSQFWVNRPASEVSSQFSINDAANNDDERQSLLRGTIRGGGRHLPIVDMTARTAPAPRSCSIL